MNNENNSNSGNNIETLETLDINLSNQNSTNNEAVLNGNTVMLNDSNNILQNQNINPSPVPDPAYTNPQNINPMPGFEPPGNIGTTPPLSYEQDVVLKKKPVNKTFFVIIVIILLFGIGIGTFWVLRYTDLLNSAPKIEIKTKTLEFNMGDKLPTDIREYANITGTDIKNCVLNKDEVDITKAGTYHYTVTCGEIPRKGVITIVDNTELVVNTNKVYKVKGDSITATEFIVSPVSNLSYEITNREEIESLLNSTNDVAGDYKVKIKVSDGIKTTEVEADLTILAYKIKGYLNCSSKEQNVLNSSAKMTVLESFAIANDGNNGFGGIANSTYTFVFSDEMAYMNYVAEYNNKGKITINNISGNPTFDNTKLTITINIERSKKYLESEFGIEAIENYKSIRTYFMDTLGYTCSYDIKR